MTGYSVSPTNGEDYAMVAYNASTGARLWLTRYDGPGGSEDEAYSVTSTPDGSKVLVTGYSAGTTTGLDYATVAYNAANGARLWEARYNGGRNGSDYAKSVASSPDGSKVFVTGYSPTTTSGQDYVTVAYNAATGAQLWLARYNGPGNESDYGRSVVASPDGTKIFVTGTSWADVTGRDYATVAYAASNGARLWVARYSSPDERSDYGRSIAASPDGSMVFVTGASFGATTGPDYATLAYDAKSGTTVWVARYNGPRNGADSAYSIASSPDGGNVVVAGVSPGTTTGQDYATVTYSA